MRHGLNKDLGFTEADRVENIRRVAEGIDTTISTPEDAAELIVVHLRRMGILELS